MKKIRKRLSVMRLEERVLFDAAAAVAAVEAQNQIQESEELQQQQQQLQEQMAEEAAKQAEAQAQQAAAEQQSAGSAENDDDGGHGGAEQGAEVQQGAEVVSAGSEVADAVEAIVSDNGVEGAEIDDVLESTSDDVVGETLEGLNDNESVTAEDNEVAINAESDDADEDSSVLMSSEEIAAAIAEGTRHELVIVSSSVKDSKVIIDSLAEGTEVLVLEQGSDVLDQINEYLDESAVKYDAIHVVGHGGDGYMVLNGSLIDMESLEADPASWAAIGEHIAEDGDILLYGCDVAKSENGKAFASQIASLTGADVAASIDTVGGDYGWELEYVTAAVSTPVLSITGYDHRMTDYRISLFYNDQETGAARWRWEALIGEAAEYNTTWRVVNANDDFVDIADADLAVDDALLAQLRIQTRVNADADWTDTNAGTFEWAMAQEDVTSITANADFSTVGSFEVTLDGDETISFVMGNNNINITITNAVTGNIEVATDSTGAVNPVAGNVTIGNFDINGGSLTVNAAGNVQINNNGGNDTLDVKNGASLTLTAEGDLTFGNDLRLNLAADDQDETTGGGTVSLNVGGTLTVDVTEDEEPENNTSVTVSGGAASSLSLNANNDVKFGSITVGTTAAVDTPEVSTTFTLSGTQAQVGEQLRADTITVNAGDILNINNGHWQAETVTLEAQSALSVGNGTSLTVSGEDIEVRGTGTVYVQGQTFAQISALDTVAQGQLLAEIADVNHGKLAVNGDAQISGSGLITVLGESDQNTNTTYGIDLANQVDLRISNATVSLWKMNTEVNKLQAGDYYGAGSYSQGGTTSIALRNGAILNLNLESDATNGTPFETTLNVNNSTFNYTHYGANALNLNHAITLNHASTTPDTRLNITNAAGEGNTGAITVSELTVSSGTARIAGNFSVTNLVLQQQGANSATLVVQGAGTDITLQSGPDGSITDHAGNWIEVSDAAELTIDLESRTQGGQIIPTILKSGLQVEGGTLTINGFNARIEGDVIGGLFESDSVININGNDLTFSEYVGLGKFGGTLNITGSGTGILFANEVTNGYGWYQLNDYNPWDDASYTSYDLPGVVDDAENDDYIVLNSRDQSAFDLREFYANNSESYLDWFLGTINVKGKVVFNDAVISTGHFNIQAADAGMTATNVTFASSSGGEGASANAYLAVAAGTFTIAEGTKVTFGSNVYISAVYNGRNTEFTINGGEVTFSTDVMNWVRSWRGNHDYNIGEMPLDANEDFVQRTQDNVSYLVLFKRTDVSSVVRFNGGVVTFSEGTYYNYGNFGVAATYVENSATVAFKNVENISYGVMTPSAGSYSNGAYAWDSRINEWHPYVDNSVAVDGALSLNLSGAIFQIKGSTTVTGTFDNAGANASKTQWAGYTDVVNGAGLYVSGSGNKFEGALSNYDLAYVDLGGSDNDYYEINNNIGNNGGVYRDTEISLSGKNRFGLVQNNGRMGFTNIANAQLRFVSFVNGNATFAGNNSGVIFTAGAGNEPGIDLRGGQVSVNSDFGSPGIASDINVAAGAALNFLTTNSVTGNITNAGNIIIGGWEGTDAFILSGNITNNGQIIVNNKLDFGADAAIRNGGNGVFDASYSGQIFDVAFVNQGILNINKTSAFSQLVNDANGQIVFNAESGSISGAEYSVFSNLINRGTISLNVSSVLFTDGLINRGTMTFANAGTRFSNLLDNGSEVSREKRAWWSEYSENHTFAAGDNTFLNYGTIELNAASADNQYFEVANYGAIRVNADTQFGKITNAEGGYISVFAPNKITFAGTVENNGFIGNAEGQQGGSGTVTFKYAATGTGAFNFINTGSVIYDFDDGAEPEVDANGFYRVGGEMVYYVDDTGRLQAVDHYSNRPEFDTQRGAWVIGDAVVSTYGSEFDAYVKGNYWYIGGEKVADVEAEIEYDNANGYWTCNDTQINGLTLGEGTVVNDSGQWIIQDANGQKLAEINRQGDNWVIVTDPDTSSETHYVAGTVEGVEAVEAVVGYYTFSRSVNAPTDGNHGHWQVEIDNDTTTIDNDTTTRALGRIDSATVNNNSWGEGEELAVNVGQTLFGGTVGTLTVRGDAVLESINDDNNTVYAKGVALGEGLELTVLTRLDNTGDNNAVDGIRFELGGGSTLTLKGDGYADDGNSSLRLLAGSTLNVDLSTTAGIVAQQDINGEVINERGTVRVAEKISLNFNGKVSGNGFVAGAKDSTVTYGAGSADVVDEDENGVVDEDENGNKIRVINVFSGVRYVDSNAYSYDNLVIKGEARLEGNAAVNDLNIGTNTLTVENGTFTLLENVNAESEFVFGRFGKGDFRSALNPYTIASITVNNDSYGVSFAGTTLGSKITVNTLVNNKTSDEALTGDEDFQENYIGVTASGYVDFTNVTNNGEFTVNSANVDLGTFTNAASTGTYTAGTLNINVGNGTLYTLSDSITNAAAADDDATDAVINLNSGNIIINGGTFNGRVNVGESPEGDNEPEFTASLTVNGTNFDLITVNSGSELRTTGNVDLGTTGAGEGLTLNGKLFVDGGTLNIYGFTGTNSDAGVADITVEDNATLNLIEGVGTYGSVNVDIESIGGTVNRNDRIEDVGLLSEWIVIDANVSVSGLTEWDDANHGNTYKFLIRDGSTLTVNATRDGAEFYFRLDADGNDAGNTGAQLVFATDVTVSGETELGSGAGVTVNDGSEVTFSGEFSADNGTITVNGTGSTIFGTVSGSATVTSGADASVTYTADETAVFGGTYGTLTVNAADVTIGNITLATALTTTVDRSSAIVNGNIAGTGSITGSADAKLSVTYTGGKQQTILGTGAGADDAYWDLTFAGEHIISSNVTVAHDLTISDVGHKAGIELQEDVTLKLNRAVDATSGDIQYVFIDGANGSTVIYDYTGDPNQELVMFRGNYFNVQLLGANSTYGVADFRLDNQLSGNAQLVVNDLDESSNGSVVAYTPTTGGAEQYMSVTYGADSLRVLGGTYENLSVNHDGVVDVLRDVIVRGAFDNYADLTTNNGADFTISGSSTGFGRFGTINELTGSYVDYAGDVTYNSSEAGQEIISGYYSNLNFSGAAKSVVSNFSVSGELRTGSSISFDETSFEDLTVNVGKLTQIADDGIRTITVSSGHTLSFGADSTILDLNNEGNVVITGGTYESLDNLENQGSLTIGQDAVVTLNDETLHVDTAGNPTGRIVVDGRLIFSGVYDNKADLTVNAGGYIDLVGAQLQVTALAGTGNVTLSADGSNNTSILTFVGTGMGVGGDEYDYPEKYDGVNFEGMKPVNYFGGTLTVNGTNDIPASGAADEIYNQLDVRGAFEVQNLILKGDAHVIAGGDGGNGSYLVLNYVNYGDALRNERRYTIEVANESTIFFKGQYLNETPITQTIWCTIEEPDRCHVVYDETFFNIHVNGYWIDVDAEFIENWGVDDVLSGNKGYRIYDGITWELTLTQATVDSEFWIETGATLKVDGQTDTDTEFTFSDNVTNLGTVIVADGLTVNFGKVYDDNTVTGGEANSVPGIVNAAGATVSYAGADQRGDNKTVFGGTYGTLIINGSVETDANFTINTLTVNDNERGDSVATFNGAVEVKTALNGDGDLVFMGEVRGNGVGEENTSSERLDVTYGTLSGNHIFAGRFGEVVLNVDKSTLRSKEYEFTSLENNAVLGGDGTVSVDEMSGTGSVLFTGGSFTLTGESETAQTLQSGTYYDLTINGSWVEDEELATNLRDVTVTHKLAGNGTINFTGTTAGDAVVEGLNDGYITAVYEDKAEKIFGGTYENLTVNGTAGRTVNAGLTVNDTLTVGGNLTAEGNVDWVFGKVAGAAGKTLDKFTFTNEEGSVTFNDGNVIGGTYGTLNVVPADPADPADLKNITIYGDVTVGTKANFGTDASVISAYDSKSNVTFNGTVITGGAAFGTAEAAYEGQVTYNGATGILGGNYAKLTFTGNNTVNAGVTVNANDVKILGVTTGEGDKAVVTPGTLTVEGTVNFKGTTDAAGNAAQIIGGKNSGSVTYAENADVYGGKYYDLTIKGDHSLNHDFSVAGKASVSGTQTLEGEVSIRFTGTTEDSGNAKFEDGLDSGETPALSSVYYGENAQTIFNGEYDNLEIYGEHELTKNLTVNGEAVITGKQTVKGTDITIDFRGATRGEAEFAQAAETTSTVIYAAGEDSVIFGGEYYNLTIKNDAALNSSLNVANAARISGLQTVAEGVEIAFNGSTDANVAGNKGTFAGAGTVSYNGASANVYGGTYGKLIISGNHDLSHGFTANAAEISDTQTIKGNITLTFAGINKGTGTLADDVNDPVFSKVVYTESASGVFGGSYGDLEIQSAQNLNNSFSVAGLATLSGKQVLGTGVAVTFNGTTNAGGAAAGTGSGSTGSGTGSNAAAAATFDGSNGSVSYGAKADVYGGTYGDLTITGDHALGNDFTVNGKSTITGVMSGNAKVTFGSSSTLGDNSTGTFGSKDAAYEGLVTYKGGSGSAASGAGVYSGAYTDLTLDGNLTITDKLISVAGAATVNGTQTLSGSTSVTFAGTTAGEGAIDGKSNSNVTYKETADVIKGTYYDLTIDGSKDIAGDLTVTNKLSLTDGTVLSGSGTWSFVTTNASEKSTATIENTGSVTYTTASADGGWIYGGAYNKLTLNGSYSVGDVVINDTISTTGAGKTVTFKGSVGGSGSFVGTTTNGTTNYLSAVYDNGGDILKGTYQDLSVKGTGNIVSETVVKGKLTALPTTTVSGGAISGGSSTSYAVITGAGALKLEGDLVGFNNEETGTNTGTGRFAHTGNVILAGSSYKIDGGNQKNSFGTLTVGEGDSDTTQLTLANSTVGTLSTAKGTTSNVSDSTFTTIKGEGDINIDKAVTGGSINMADGTVTYKEKASATLIYGTYNNLTLKQIENGVKPTIKVDGNITVTKLFDIGVHKIENSGTLMMYQFKNEADLTNTGKLTFGSNDEKLENPGAQSWDGSITNKGTITINRGNYTFADIENDGDSKASITVTKDAENRLVTFSKLTNEFGASVTLNSKTQISEMDKVNGGWINEGDLTIDGFSNFGFDVDADTQLELTLANRSSLTINNGGVFKLSDDGENFVTEGYTFGGYITLNNGGSVKIGGGTEAIFIDVNEIVGTKSYETVGDGTIIFGFGDTTAVYQQGLYGDLKNNGNMYFLSTGMKYLGNVTNGSASADTDGNMFIYADSTFKGTVNSEYGWVIVGDGAEAVNATFINTVHSGSAFLIRSDSHAAFESTLTTAHQFTIEDGGSALFKGDVTVSASSNNEADTVFTVENGATAEFLGNLTNTNTGTAWHSVLQIDGTVAVNGTLTNTAGSTASNVANVIITSDDNTFGAITNTGAAAKFELNSNNNQFNGVTTNSGQLYLNGVNTFNAISNSGAGYLWINDGASGSIFQGNINNSGTMTVASSNAAAGTIDLTFNGTVVNSGTVNLNAAGSVFNGAVTNHNTFNVYAGATFDGLLTNSGTFNVSADGVSFNKVDNSGTFAVNAAGTVFGGLFTNSGTLDVNVANIVFPEMNNSGKVNLHGAHQTVIENLIQNGGTIDIDKASTLHLHVVSDDAASQIIVRGEREGVYEEHTEPNVSDSGHGLYFENVDGAKDDPQVINAKITYEGDVIENAVWFNEDYTYLVGEESTWIIVDSAMTIDNFSEKGKYRVVAGGVLTVIGTASGSRFQVTGNGILNFANTHELTVNGMVEVKGADAQLNLGGADNTFNGKVTNKGTVTVKAESQNNFAGSLINDNLVNAYATVEGTVINNGTYVIKTDGIEINDGITSSENGTITIEADATLNTDVEDGKIVIKKGATLDAAVTEINADLQNNGTVAMGDELTVNGDILDGNGTFSSSSENASLVFSGNVDEGSSAVFDNIADVSYTGTGEQNIIQGTYDNLILENSEKTVAGTVTVKGSVSNQSGIAVSEDGKLNVDGELDGDGAYENAGELTFGENASGTAAAVTNNGVVNADGAVTVGTLTNSSEAEFNANSDEVRVADGTNSGNINVNGDDVRVAVINNADGSITVNGEDAVLGGWNLGDISVSDGGSAATTMKDQSGASYNVAEGGEISLGNNGGTYKADINNEGTVTIDAEISDFAGTVSNSGVVKVNEGENLDVEGLMAGNSNGTVEVHDETVLSGEELQGNVQLYVEVKDEDLAGTSIAEGATLGINVDSELTRPIADNNGTVQVGKDATLTYTVDGEISGNYDVDGTVSVNGNAEFTGAVDNGGTIETSEDGEVTFSGKTTGAGDVNGNAVYDGEATGVYGGTYDNLTVNTNATVNADAEVIGAMNLNGSLATAAGVDITISGETNGEGTMAGGNGEVIYNGTGDIGQGEGQSIYAGQYNDLTIGEDAYGNFDIKGDISVKGDAVNNSPDAELIIDDGKVNYNGSGSQQVMAGTYDELIMSGSGSKEMEADTFNVNSFSANGVTLNSASAPAQWTLNSTGNVSINNSVINDANSTTPIFLNGTNTTGGNISGNWAVFNAAGGVGDMYPSLKNPNFHALAGYVSNLEAEWGSTGRFDAFRRMPTSRQPIAVGDMSDLVMLNNFGSYDMIDFDSEFFGNGDGIGLLDEEEAREVLTDSAPADLGDLRALIEEK